MALRTSTQVMSAICSVFGSGWVSGCCTTNRATTTPPMPAIASSAPTRAGALMKCEYEACVGNAGAGGRPDRPRGDRVGEDAVGAEFDREIRHRPFERSLGDALRVVVRHRRPAAVIGERPHGAAVR